MRYGSTSSTHYWQEIRKQRWQEEETKDFLQTTRLEADNVEEKFKKQPDMKSEKQHLE